MATPTLTEIVDEQEWLKPVGDVLEETASRAFTRANPVQREAKNLLHGTWLGHPLHPALTDVPLGAWTAAAVMDAVDLVSPSEKLEAGADAAVAVGLVGAVGAALAGLNDWQYARDHTRRIGVVHGLLNVGDTLLYATSLAMRRRGARRTGRALGFLGLAVGTVSAYLGGHLVYGHRMGVDRTAGYQPSKEFVPVLDEAELAEGQVCKVEADGVPVFLVRLDGEIRAICETCTHMGGPLSEGKLEGKSIVCPWHGSRFALDDAGHVLDGPAVFPERCFETRVRDGRIEVRSTT